MPFSAFQPVGGWERGVLKKVLYGGGGGGGGAPPGGPTLLFYLPFLTEKVPFGIISALPLDPPLNILL